MALPWNRRSSADLAILALIRQELEPLHSELAALRSDLKGTYSREMIDQMLARSSDTRTADIEALKEEVRGVRETVNAIKADTLDHREKLASRIALVVSTSYVLINLLPHLGNLLKP